MRHMENVWKCIIEPKRLDMHASKFHLQLNTAHSSFHTNLVEAMIYLKECKKDLFWKCIVILR